MLKKKLKPIAIFLGISVLAHFFFALSLILTPTDSQMATENIEVSYLDETEAANEIAKIRRAKQIVDQDVRLNDEKDEKAKYLGAFDQKVLEETKAERSGELKNTAGGGKTPEKSREKEIAGELPSLKKLTPSFQSKHESPFQGEGPNEGEASQTDDHLENVKSGLQTLLSTREFVYFSYYSRIKRQIRQHWEPGVREKVKIIYKQGRNIASAKDRVTQVLVTLDKDGSLIKVEVLSPSGVHDLDAAAIEAFEAAAPFPNPPKGIIEGDGTIKIRWDFVLEA